jgi:hypothetical protein
MLLGHEAKHSLPPTTEIRNAWSYNSISPIIFVAWCLIEHRDKFALCLSENNFLSHVGWVNFNASLENVALEAFIQHIAAVNLQIY